ncbi:hypothetical protein RUM43_012658 [Polyplax serrata]|uniref:Peptidase M12B domain-containing protein n=1 Tax=Polyplax serrata TaxID=468196 RepID=A0AAN8PHZ4_POLSC
MGAISLSFAYVGGACVVNKRLEKVNSVAIIEDTGGFSGIIVAAHEVGHLLGAVHDGSPPPSYLGGPGAEKCRWEDGFIMSDLRHTEKGFKWSSCSVASFHHFLNGDTATCLFNSPHEDESLPRVLPGKLLSLDAQCRKDRGTSACFKDDRVCSQLFCFDSGSGYCVAYRPAAEGSPCGDGQYCINGRCVAEHENIIPDYSQNGQFFRRDDSENFATQPRPIVAYPNPSTQRSFQNNYRTQKTNSSPFSGSSFSTTPKSHYNNPVSTPRTVSKQQSYNSPFNNVNSTPKSHSFNSPFRSGFTTSRTTPKYQNFNSHKTTKSQNNNSPFPNFFSTPFRPFSTPLTTQKPQAYNNPFSTSRTTIKQQNNYNNHYYSQRPNAKSYNPYSTPQTTPKPQIVNLPYNSVFVTPRSLVQPQNVYNNNIIRISTPAPVVLSSTPVYNNPFISVTAQRPATASTRHPYDVSHLLRRNYNKKSV